MGIFSFFSQDKNSEIQSLQDTIKNAKLGIENERRNMARYPSNKNYQEGQKKKIAYHKWLIATSKQKIASLKAK